MEFYFKLGLILSVSILAESRVRDLGNLLGDLEKKVFSYQALHEKPYKPPFNWYVLLIITLLNGSLLLHFPKLLLN